MLNWYADGNEWSFSSTMGWWVEKWLPKKPFGHHRSFLESCTKEITDSAHFVKTTLSVIYYDALQMRDKAIWIGSAKLLDKWSVKYRNRNNAEISRDVGLADVHRQA